VLVFPGQKLSDPEQRRFAETFGPLGARKRRREDRPSGDGNDHVMLITNIRENGVPIGSLPDGEMLFHHDMCYQRAPDMATFLYGIEIPSWGGQTLFANMYSAYDTLPRDIRDRIDGRLVAQVYQYHPMNRIEADEDFSAYDHHLQPAVVVHPMTGRKALYVNQLMSVRIEGLPRGESEELLAFIRAHVARPEHVYAHSWTPGDLVMWDNVCSCHARTDFPPEETRLLRRCTVAGCALQAA